MEPEREFLVDCCLFNGGYPGFHVCLGTVGAGHKQIPLITVDLVVKTQTTFPEIQVPMLKQNSLSSECVLGCTKMEPHNRTAVSKKHFFPGGALQPSTLNP